MADLADGESTQMKGSAREPYELKNTGGVYSCTCPAWRNQSVAIERRTCKHLRKLRGSAEEDARCGAPSPRVVKPAAEGEIAPPLLLAHTWQDTDITGWWMSEKLDGVRAYWKDGQFISRLGNRYVAPAWFTKDLPAGPLDGELWAGRKKFQRAVSIARRQDASEHWKELTFVVFDAPAMDAPFEARMAWCDEQLAKTAHARAHTQVRCRGTEHLHEELARVEALGGEGLMLREPGSRYEVGRSTTLLKVKTFHDAEARVIDHQPGEGRHAGRLGALVVELPDGTRFSVGTGLSDKERGAPPAIGSTITFRYQELSDGGVPRFPSFVRVHESSVGTKPAPTSNAASPTPASAARRLELVEGTSSKFWQITVDGASHTVCYGRIGTSGQSKTKSFASQEAASADAERLVEEKLAKGYALVPSR